MTQPLTSTIPLPAENISDYHNVYKVGDKLYLFSRHFHNQPNFNWGQRVIHKGGYVCVFDLIKNEWESNNTYAAITDDENIEELAFVSNDILYVLLFANFGAVHFNSLHKWNGVAFENVPIQSSVNVKDDSEEGKCNVQMVLADSEDGNTKYLVSKMHVHRIHKLDLTAGTITDVMTVEVDGLFAMGKVVSAFVRGNRLIISYGVMGCGFRWEASRFIECDLAAKTSKEVMASNDEQPKFSFSGARFHYASGNKWYHVSGATQVGMCGSDYHGLIYELDTDTYTWTKHTGEIGGNYSGCLAFGTVSGGVVYAGAKDNGIATLTL